MSKRIISVIGLGYVGLPVAVAFSKVYKVIGFDLNKSRIKDLANNYDNTAEFSESELKSLSLDLYSDPSHINKANFHIITVPTPIDSANNPDLECLINATITVAKNLKPNDIVVYESTVYPGTTEEVCIPILEQHSNLKVNIDFGVGYSPERINPGDKERTLSEVAKLVAGSNHETCEVVRQVYEKIIKAGVYPTENIKIAEAAKIIENTQRDLNIALMNELAIIFDKMAIDTQKVLAAASTKWNFLKFTPGLVGGHCIGVDPYYLTYKAKQLGHRPEVILAGRRINDNMGKYIAERMIKTMIKADINIKNAKIGILGLTFKENCPDLRNSKVFDVISELTSYGIIVKVHDPIACPLAAQKEYNLELSEWENLTDLDAIMVCVAHRHYQELNPQEFYSKFKNPNETKIIADLKAIYSEDMFDKKEFNIWRL